MIQNRNRDARQQRCNLTLGKPMNFSAKKQQQQNHLGMKPI